MANHKKAAGVWVKIPCIGDIGDIGFCDYDECMVWKSWSGLILLESNSETTYSMPMPFQMVPFSNGKKVANATMFDINAHFSAEFIQCMFAV